MPAGIYYYSDREYYLNISREYSNNNREYLLKKTRDKYNNSQEEKKIEYGKNRYHNMSSQKKLELKAYQKEYREMKKAQGNLAKDAVLTP